MIRLQIQHYTIIDLTVAIHLVTVRS